LHRMTERGSSVTVKAKPCGRCAAWTELAARASKNTSPICNHASRNGYSERITNSTGGTMIRLIIEIDLRGLRLHQLLAWLMYFRC
jgi:hypothetical protein